jgi:hypothetical protein
VRTRSFTSLVILRWDGCAASRVSGGWLCSPHFTPTSSSQLDYDRLAKERGSRSGPSSKGVGVFPLLGHGNHRMYQTCRSAARTPIL